jgi:hypothetical protein
VPSLTPIGPASSGKIQVPTILIPALATGAFNRYHEETAPAHDGGRMTERPLQHRIGEICAGSALGVLVGVLLGLSVTQVVGGVIASLAAILAAFFGLVAPGQAQTADRTWRIAGFGFACTLGVLLGVAARSHDWLSEPLAEQVRRWTQAGASPEDAVAYVAYRQLGIVPSGRSIVPPKPSEAGSVLFAAHDPATCARLRRSRFGAPADRLSAMGNAGAGWASFAAALRDLPAERLDPVLEAGYQLVCGS